MIPKKTLKELGLRPGDEVSVKISRNKKSVLIHLSAKLSRHQQRIAELTFGFINRYRKDLEALSKK